MADASKSNDYAVAGSISTTAPITKVNGDVAKDGHLPTATVSKLIGYAVLDERPDVLSINKITAYVVTVTTDSTAG